MFKLTKPCSNCPFRKGQGEGFKLGVERVLDIMNGSAFQCHKTIDYEHFDDPFLRQGASAQQCAGVMSLLHRAGLPNDIMQVGERLGYFDPTKLEHGDVYDDLADALEAHSAGRDWGKAAAEYDPHQQRLAAPQVIQGEPTRGRMPNFIRAWERFDGGEGNYH